MNKKSALLEVAAPLQRTCIIVAGMHRSGTSAVTRVVNLLGADITRTLMLPMAGNNDRGFWEPARVVEIHDRLLHALGSSYDDPLPLPEGWLESNAAQETKQRLAEEIEKDFADSSLFVMKDPRVARLLPLWLALLDQLEIEPVVVIPIRNPLEVASSLAKREGLSAAQSLLIYARSYLETELASRRRRRLFVRYDQLLNDWRILEGKLRTMLGSLLPRPRAELAIEIESFLTRDLYRNRCTRAELGNAPHVACTVVEIFDRMVKVSESAVAESTFRKAFDRLRETVGEATRLYQGIVLSERQARRDIAAQLEAKAAAARARSAELEQALQARAVAVTELEQALAGRAATVAQLQDEIASAHGRAADLQQQLSALDACAKETARRLESQLETAQRHSAELARELEQRSAAAAHLEYQLAEQGRQVAAQARELASITRSRSWRLTAPLRKFAARAPLLSRSLETLRRICTFQFWLPNRNSLFERSDRKLIVLSSLFDSDWYLNNNPDVRACGGDAALHYLQHGAWEGRQPSPLFDSSWYLDQNPDVRLSGLNPLVHYLRFGIKEGRKPTASALMAAQVEEKALSLSFTSSGSGIRTVAVSHNLNLEGAPNSLFELMAGLRRRNVIEPIVISPHDGPLRSFYDKAGITTALISPPDTRGINEFDSSIAAVARAFRESRAQIVHVNTLQAFWAVMAAQRASIPAIWNVRESEPWETYFDFLPPELRSQVYRAFEYPYRIVFVAHATRQVWEPLNSHANFATIHNGLDLDRVRDRTANRDRQAIRASLRILPSEIAVVLLGTVCERKGQIDLVRALALLPQDLVPRSRFFIVGDGPTHYSSLLHETAAKLSSDRAARLAIVPATDDPYRYFQAADIAVCCSRLESYPRVILEAMAFDLPIITTPVFGIAEQVQDQVNGFFYEPDDVDQLAACLARLISADALRARLASNSRHVLEGLPNHDDMLEAYARLIKQATLAGETSSRRAVGGERQSTGERRAV